MFCTCVWYTLYIYCTYIHLFFEGKFCMFCQHVHGCQGFMMFYANHGRVKHRETTRPKHRKPLYHLLRTCGQFMAVTMSKPLKKKLMKRISKQKEKNPCYISRVGADGTKKVQGTKALAKTAEYTFAFSRKLLQSWRQHAGY